MFWIEIWIHCLPIFWEIMWTFHLVGSWTTIHWICGCILAGIFQRPGHIQRTPQDTCTARAAGAVGHFWPAEFRKRKLIRLQQRVACRLERCDHVLLCEALTIRQPFPLPETSISLPKRSRICFKIWARATNFPRASGSKAGSSANLTKTKKLQLSNVCSQLALLDFLWISPYFCQKFSNLEISKPENLEMSKPQNTIKHQDTRP